MITYVIPVSYSAEMCGMAFPGVEVPAGVGVLLVLRRVLALPVTRYI
jgi:hypothetical protein